MGELMPPPFFPFGVLGPVWVWLMLVLDLRRRFWIVVPSMIVWTLGKDLVELLHVAQEKTVGKKTI